MQENGVPVTFAYISDAHDNHTLGRASGPGEADYQAAAEVVRRCVRDVLPAAAERRHRQVEHALRRHRRRGRPLRRRHGHPDPAKAGALIYNHTPCLTPTSCPANQIGEVNANINAALPAGEPSFDIHFDDAPTFYVNGQPERTNPALRKLEQDAGAATLPDPYKGGAQTPIAFRLADTVEENALHMVNSDPKRTPSFTMFGDDDFFFQIGNVCKGKSPDPGVRRMRQSGASPGTTATRRTRSATPGSAWSARASRIAASTARHGPITST